MNEDYQISYVDKPEESAWGISGRGLDSYNQQQAGDYHIQRLCLLCAHPAGKLQEVH